MTMTFDDPITFAGAPLDRAAEKRKDGAWLGSRLMDTNTRILPMFRLKALIDIEHGAEIGWRSPTEMLEALEDARPILLGTDDDGVAHFAVDVSRAPSPRNSPYASRGKFIDVRSIAGALRPGQASLLAQARSMVDWHSRHRFCAVCGAPSDMREAGYMRQCSNEDCNAPHFPRTDPVTIMLVFHGDNVLLGRQPMFPPGNYSALAGFMEPGESIEECVRREIWEEAGIKVGDVRYVASQPWPYPSSLMIGCFAEALNTDINIDPEELDDAQWFPRDEVIRMIERAEDPRSAEPRMPPALSLAHQLARRWLAGV